MVMQKDMGRLESDTELYEAPTWIHYPDGHGLGWGSILRCLRFAQIRRTVRSNLNHGANYLWSLCMIYSPVR